MKLISISHLIDNKVIKQIDVRIKDCIEALAIIAYIKREDWDKVGICGICYGKGDKSSSGAYSHSWERETCKCSYGLVEGWQLSHSLVYKDYENKLMNTSVVLELFDKEYKGLYI